MIVALRGCFFEIHTLKLVKITISQTKYRDPNNNKQLKNSRHIYLDQMVGHSRESSFYSLFRTILVF